MPSPFDARSAGSVSGEYPTNRVLVRLFFYLVIFGVVVFLLYLSGTLSLTRFLAAIVGLP